MVYLIVGILVLFIIGIITSDPDSDYDDYSSSSVFGDKIQHYTLLGSYDGYSVKNGEKVDHYTECCGIWKGSSVKTKDGYSHRDVFGNETSRSRKES